MKKALKILGIWLLFLLIIWAFTAFLLMEMNPANWNIETRTCVAVFAGYALYGSASILIE